MPIVLPALLKIIFMVAMIMVMVVVLIWAERKGSAFIQDRTGPNRAVIGGVRLAGLVHPVADVLKLLFKEDVTPAHRHRAFYNMAPWLVMTVALTTYAVIPFGDHLTVAGHQFQLVVADLEVGILFVLAIASLGTYGVVLAGWASSNKFSFLGGLRASAQMISYEITMALAVMGLILVFSTLRLTDMVAGQGELLFGILPKWGVVVQPLGFILFIVAVFAETNRTPFDMPEADPEIVAGYHLEYSSMKFALFFMAEYAHMVVGASLIATLYFGGYQVPWLPRPLLEQHAGAPHGSGVVGRCGRRRPRRAADEILDHRSGRRGIVRHHRPGGRLPREDGFLRLGVHLGALDRASFPFRPADASGLESDVASGVGQSRRHRAGDDIRLRRVVR